MLDCIIMNPPYNRTLHLQILEKVIKFCDKVVNISPASWLLDLTAITNLKKIIYQKYENTVAKHIVSLDILTGAEASNTFDAAFFQSVGIYYIDKTVESDFYSKVVFKNTLKNLSIFNKTIMKVHRNELDNLYQHIKISTINGHVGAKDEFDIVTLNYDLARKFKPIDMSELEFKNWHASCNTKFMKYCNYLTRNGQHITANWLPYMNDYSFNWTDKMFYDFFKLTKEEIDIIEQFGKRYT